MVAVHAFLLRAPVVVWTPPATLCTRNAVPMAAGRRWGMSIFQPATDRALWVAEGVVAQLCQAFCMEHMSAPSGPPRILGPTW
eukprot:324052-Alexandrium_andersonii.AAC.1